MVARIVIANLRSLLLLASGIPVQSIREHPQATHIAAFV